MKVHNINGTADNKCKCGSWRAHWENFNEYHFVWPKYCSEKSCLYAPTIGAHVQKEESSSAKWFIIPLCDRHNGAEFHGKTIEVNDGTSFALASRRETCER